MHSLPPLMSSHRKMNAVPAPINPFLENCNRDRFVTCTVTLITFVACPGGGKTHTLILYALYAQRSKIRILESL